MTDLIVPDIPEGDDWHEIVNRMVETIEEGQEVPDKVIQAAEMMIAGVPAYKIARELEVKTKTVRGWLTKYPLVSYAVSNARKDIQKWRLSLIEQQFVSAVNKSAEVINAKPYAVTDINGNIVYDEDDNPVIVDPNAKLLGVQAQHARYLISLFLGNKIDLNVTVRDETPVMKAKADAMDYLAKKMADLITSGEPRETIIVVQDPKKESGPLLTEDDKPNFGSLGVLDINPDGALCHVCGKRFAQLEIHVRTKHSLSNDMYETVFMLPPGALKDAAKSD